jgi:hypothetical protein
VATRPSLPPIRDPNRINGFGGLITPAPPAPATTPARSFKSLPKYHRNLRPTPPVLNKPHFTTPQPSNLPRPIPQPQHLTRQTLFTAEQNYQTPQIYLDHKPRVQPPLPVQEITTSNPPSNTTKPATQIDFTELYYQEQTRLTILSAILGLVGFVSLIMIIADYVFTSSPLVFWGLSSQLFATNPFGFVTSYLSNYLLLILHYLHQFGLFITPKTRPDFIYPIWWLLIDVGIKAGLIIYLQFYWQKWDRQNLIEKGCFHPHYPFALDVEPEIDLEIDHQDLYNEFWLATNSLRKEQGLPPLPKPSANPQPTTSHSAPDQQLPPSPHLDWQVYDTDSQIDTDQGLNQPIFEGILSPLKQWLYKHRQELYGTLRGFVIPTLTSIIAITLSLFFVLDPRNPIYILFYVLSITSLFWLNQNIVAVMDHCRWRVG